MLWAYSLRAQRPSIQVPCFILPENTIERELFGTDDGDTPSRPGAFETASDGTILLDEVAALPLSTQAKLLYVLQEHEFERCGSNTVIPVTARLLATTRHPLEQLLRDGQFHAGLYYQLSVFPIYVPALRQRKADIPLLARSFLNHSNSKFNRHVKDISISAMDILMNHAWPGNVRELEDTIEHAVCVCPGNILQPQDLPPILCVGKSATTPLDNLKTTLETVEKGMIMDSLKAHHGNMAAAARQLGLTERMMGLRVQKYRIDLEFFKQRQPQEDHVS